jgi:hypothetical protein
MSLDLHNSGRLLLFGKDFMLLETRAEVLRSAGSIVDVACDVAALKARMAAPGPVYDVLICCHTVTEIVCNELLAIARRNGTATLKLERLLAPTELINQVSKLIDAARSSQDIEENSVS